MRVFAAHALALLTMAVASNAEADLVSLASLPEGAILPMPLENERPEEVAASQRSAHIFPSLPTPDQLQHMPPGTHFVRLFPTKELAEAHTQRGLGSVVEAMMDGGPRAGTCFTVADSWFMRQDAGQWPINADLEPTLHAVKKGSPSARHHHEPMVRAVRVESLAIDPAGTAALTTASAWVDPISLGVQTIAESTLKLTRIGQAHGVTILAARDPSGRAVHFVVHQDRPSGRAGLFTGRHMQVLRGNNGGHSSCGQASFTLHASPVGGDQARVELDAVLAIDEIPEEDGKRGLMGVFRRHEVAEPLQPREMRVRPMQVHLAVSQSSSDADPVVTLSFGWNGKERVHPIF
jgi:hypothetical protein